MPKKNVHIIGAARGIGRWLIERVFIPQAEGFNIFCYDLQKNGLESLPAKITTSCLIDNNSQYTNYTGNFSEADWILLAIPLNSIAETLASLSGVIKKDSLFIPLTSVQQAAIEAVKSLSVYRQGKCGLVPLFGETIPSPIGQIVVLTEYSNDFPQHSAFKNTLSDAGLLVTELNAELHDKNMAIIQGLTHFTYFSFIHAITSNGYTPSQLLGLQTPNFQFLYAFASRVMKISATTTGAIQSTADASLMREKFLKAASELYEKFKNAGSKDECTKIVEEIRAPLTGKEVAEGVEIAAMAVDSLQRIEILLHKYRKSGNPFAFKNKVTGKLHIVRITAIHPDSVTYEESTKRIENKGSVSYAIGLNETARKNYREQGISLPPPSKEHIKKRNLQLLIAEELSKLYKSSIEPIKHTCNLNNPFNLKEEYFENGCLCW